MSGVKHKIVDHGDYLESLDQLKWDLKTIRKRLAGQSYQCKDRDTMLHDFDKGVAPFADTVYDISDHTVHASILPTPYLPCSTSFANLMPTMIKALKLEVHHRGTYLLARAITSPMRQTEILLLVEDEWDEVIALALYHQEEEHIRKANTIIDVGTVVLIKEPYLEVFDRDEYRLRVDHLSDIEFLDPFNTRVPTKWRSAVTTAHASANTLMMEGNTLLGAGSNWQAIKMYTSALSRCVIPAQRNMISWNRAEAYLRTGQYDAALTDTGYPRFEEQDAEQAICCAASALYNLGRFDDSIGVLQNLSADCPYRDQAFIMQNNAHRRLQEKLTGNHDFSQLQLEAATLSPPHLDHATYSEPVGISSTPDKGRGIFLTRAVKAGDLLLCEKAFGHTRSKEHISDPTSYTVFYELGGKRDFVGDLLPQLIQKLHKNPSLARDFMRMYSGNGDASDEEQVDGELVLDSFLIAQIMYENFQVCPLSSSTCLEPYLEVHILDPKIPSPDPLCHSRGLWTIASYVNHACNFNAERSYIGDMMIVRASKDMKSGTEVVFPYYEFRYKHEERKELSRQWGFECKCEICEEADRMVSTQSATEKERHRLVLAAHAECWDTNAELRGPHAIDTTKLSGLLDAAAQTYTRSAVQVPRLMLWPLQLHLSQVFIRTNQKQKGLASVIKCFAHLGFALNGLGDVSRPFEVVHWGRVELQVVHLFLHLALDFHSRGRSYKAIIAKDCAKTVWRIMAGADEDYERKMRGIRVLT